MLGPALVATLGLLGALTGQPDVAPRFVVTTAQEALPPAALVGIANDFTVRRDGKPPQLVPVGELISVRREGKALPGGPVPPFVLLSGGDRLPLASPPELSLEDEQLHVVLAAPLQSAAGKRLALPQAGVAAVCLALPPGVDDVDRLLRPTAGKAVRGRDVLIFRNGDRLEGSLTHLDSATGATLAQSPRSNDVPLARLAVVAFNPDLQARGRPRRVYGQTTLDSGARLRLGSLTLDDGRLKGQLTVGPTLAFPIESLVRLQMRQGRAVYLDELTPLAYESTPFLDLGWPLAVNQTLRGGPLRLSPDVYDSGLAMHSRSRVRYALGRKYRTFEATVGLDPETGRRAAVRVAVDVDGKSVPQAEKDCLAGQPPVAIRVDVRGGEQLSLVTDFGPLGDVQGYILWADARLIKEP